MSTPEDDPIQLIEVLRTLSLARNLRAYSETLEGVMVSLYGTGHVQYWRYTPGGRQAPDSLRRVLSGAETPCSEANLQGAALLNCEFTLFSQDQLPVLDFDGEVEEALAFPIKLYGTPVGVAVAINPASTEGSIPWEELSEVSGLMQDSAVRAEETAALVSHTEELLVRAVENMARGGEGHIARVGQLAAEVATLMDLSSKSRQLILKAAQYHDVGKLILMGVPLNELERTHAQVGADYLRGTRVLRDLAPVVEAHHERYDGSGPRGWKGEQVSVEAWVLALAEDLEEFRLANPSQPVAVQIRSFFEGPANHHHPAAVDALGGLLVSGRLEQLLS